MKAHHAFIPRTEILRNMPTIVADNCVACGACADACPNGAITVGDIAEIDAGKCVDCGACVDACPSEAITE